MIDWELIKAKLADTLSNEDESRFNKWVDADEKNRKLFEELKIRWNRSIDEKGQFDSNQAYEKLRSQLSSTIKSSDGTTSGSVVPIRRILTVAASIALVVVAGWLLSTTGMGQVDEIALITKSTSDTQRASIVLPDGTKVRLNIGSAISYPEKFAAEFRNVTLLGEAYFEVTRDKNRPFTISSGEIETTVLGTAFNLRAYPDEDVDVTVTEGSVRVQTKNDSQQLEIGDQAFYSVSNRKLIKRHVNVVEYIGWTVPELDFNMTPFEEVVKSLGRWYHKDLIVVGQASTECLIRAKFKNDGLIPILTGLQNIVSFEYDDSNGEEIIITNNGCIN